MIFSSPYFIIKSLQLKTFKKYVAHLKGRVLDIGCGTKPYSKYLPESDKYIGMDPNQQVRPDVLGKATELPFLSDYFDSILGTEVLEHLPEPEIAIKEIKRVLKKDGYLYLTVPQEWCLHYEPNDYFRFTKYGIKYLLEKNGFNILTIERIGGVFSLVGQRTVDVIWQIVVGRLESLFGIRYAERIASIFCFPICFIFYSLGKFGDKIDKRDALGWAIVAKK